MNQKRRGRPPKDNNATDVLPPIRVRPKQKENYQAAAKAAGLPLSAWIKRILDQAVKKN